MTPAERRLVVLVVLCGAAAGALVGLLTLGRA